MKKRATLVVLAVGLVAAAAVSTTRLAAQQSTLASLFVRYDVKPNFGQVDGKPAWGGLTSWVAADILNPVMAGFFNASCDKAMFGWPCDPQIEKMRDAFAKESDPAKQKDIAVDLQKYWVDHPTHVNLGQWFQPAAMRTSLEVAVRAGREPRAHR